MAYDQLAKHITPLVGGSDNIDSYTNCMTRLRLNVHDPDLVDDDAIKNLPGVLGTVPGNHYQIVVGPGYADRLREAFANNHQDIIGKARIDEGADNKDGESAVATALAATTKARIKAKQNRGIHTVFRHIGNIFIPLIPGFIACGLITSIANIWKLANPAIAKNPWFLVFAGLGGFSRRQPPLTCRTQYC